MVIVSVLLCVNFLCQWTQADLINVYDQNKNLIGYKEETSNGLNEEVITTYDLNKVKTSEQTLKLDSLLASYNYSLIDDHPDIKITTYDQNGNVTGYIKRYFRNDQTVLDIIFDANKKKTEQLTYKYDSSTYNPIQFNYDEKKSTIIERIYYTQNGGEKEATHYSYDNTGKLTEKTVLYILNDGVVKVTLDGNDTVKEIRAVSVSNGVFTPVYTITYSNEGPGYTIKGENPTSTEELQNFAENQHLDFSGLVNTILGQTTGSIQQSTSVGGSSATSAQQAVSHIQTTSLFMPPADWLLDALMFSPAQEVYNFAVTNHQTLTAGDKAYLRNQGVSVM